MKYNPNTNCLAIPTSTEQPMLKTCKWSIDEDGTWWTDCGNVHVFTDGGPTENRHQYCPYCGRPVTAISLRPRSGVTGEIELLYHELAAARKENARLTRETAEANDANKCHLRAGVRLEKELSEARSELAKLRAVAAEAEKGAEKAEDNDPPTVNFCHKCGKQIDGPMDRHGAYTYHWECVPIYQQWGRKPINVPKEESR